MPIIARQCIFYRIENAAVVKLVDTLASGASSRKGLGVRFSPAALGQLAQLVEAEGHLRFLRRSLLLFDGRLAQLVEQPLYTGKVTGSSPVSPTCCGATV